MSDKSTRRVAGEKPFTFDRPDLHIYYARRRRQQREAGQVARWCAASLVVLVLASILMEFIR